LAEPTVLILGCNHTQLPYLHAARDLGFRVVGVDRNPEAPGRSEVDAFYVVGYSDFDGLKGVAEKENLSSSDNIFTAAAHLAYEGAAHLAEWLGISFPKVADIDACLNKTKFYALLHEYKISVPPTHLFDVQHPHIPDPRKVHFLKSDYGKSPTYCYRIVHGKIPELPQQFDPFFRRDFLLQEEVRGDHYRVNVYGDQAAVFLKLSDHAALPLRTLGPGHSELIAKLQTLTSELGLAGWLTKFDLIVNERSWYVIDIGLDPPMRLRQLCEHQGIDFPAAYTRHYLVGDSSSLPSWDKIYRPELIAGSPEKGFVFTNLSEK
jgi:predicted ATP-grasp superfamily ATP-dependent carboligase